MGVEEEPALDLIWHQMPALRGPSVRTAQQLDIDGRSTMSKKEPVKAIRKANDRATSRARDEQAVNAGEPPARPQVVARTGAPSTAGPRSPTRSILGLAPAPALSA